MAAAPARPTRATVIPCLRYRDAPAAIDWLCNTFGFERQAVYPDDDGGIAHAQLTLGSGMVMLGSVGKKPTPWGALIRQPDEIGGAETQSSYLVVRDPDAMYARAKAAGATILLDIKDEDYGGRGFTCADPEGHIWNFGSYDPWPP
ncbi:VOC family protein [Pseudorhodoferax sp. Leaf267]|uniref:VOC family protein n=1 Tax=Pseudorhodoferax sp. Leaf267 TaxID=1736316 RepID=UPI0006F86B46|nr:VOC family protein [Pseudorhodoferax sp. Leaf267]KQP14970.1 glyoxalase [Pseudorhodoferax sp. Leaf267]